MSRNDVMNGMQYRRRRGAVAAELALTVPVLLLFGLASSDFCRVAHFQQVVSNAARTGAEVGATRQVTEFTYADWEADVHEAVLEELTNIPNVDEDDCEVSVSTSTDADGVTRLTVSVAVPFRTVVAWPALPSQVMLHSQLSTRQFR